MNDKVVEIFTYIFMLLVQIDKSKENLKHSLSYNGSYIYNRCILIRRSATAPKKTVMNMIKDKNQIVIYLQFIYKVAK